MVLYCVQHSAYILRGIVHKFKYHPQDEAVFFVDKEVPSPYCPVIDKIKFYQMPDPWEIARYSADSAEAIKEHTNKTISEFLNAIGIDLQQFSHIYATFDFYNPFTLYFEMNSVKYMLIENVDNIFATYAADVFISRRPESEYAYNRMIYDMHLQDAQGENCIKGYLNSDNSSSAGNERIPFEVFEFLEEIFRLDEEYKRQIVKGYDIEQYKFDAVLMLLSPLLTGQYLEEHGICAPAGYDRSDPNSAVYYFYKAVIDYYYRDIDFVLKLHPETDEKFEKAFAAFKQLPRQLPSEVLFFLGKRFDVLCPAESASLDIFKKHDYSVTAFSRHIFRFFKYIHFVFLAFSLMSAIVTPKKIAVHGINRIQLGHFARWVYTDFKEVEFEKLDENSVRNTAFIIADPVKDFTEIIRGAREECLIFVHGDYQAEPSFAVQRMVYSISDASDGEQGEPQEFRWTLLSKSRELMDIVREFSASYSLEHAKVRIESYPSD